MKRILLLLSFISSSIFSMELARVDYNENYNSTSFSYADNPRKMHIAPFSIKTPERLGTLNLYHGQKGFCVHQDKKKYPIKSYFTDPILRNITKTQLKAFLENGYLALNRMDNGEFSLKAKMRLNGGGAIGAAIGVFAGKAAVALVGHGAIYLIGGLTGPAAPATIIVLEAWLAPTIAAASLTGALACGIALGAATGPL